MRGNAHQVYDKYLALARDATAAGDRVAAEGFYQYAEHYFRVVNDTTDPLPDGQRRVDRSQDGVPRGEAPPAVDGGSNAPVAAARGNGAAPEGGGGEANRKSEAQAAAPAAEGTEGASEQGPRRRGLRRRRPAGGNGKSTGDDIKSASGNGKSAADENEPQEMASADGDSDVVCS